MTSVSSEPPGGGRLQQPNMSALVVSAQKKRALELLESQFGSASASSASSSSSSSSSQGASKKPKQASGSTNASHQAASNAQSLRAPEEAPFYAALARPGATSQFSFSAAAPVQGRQKLQTLVEELLPTASLFNKIANSRVLVLENPQRTLTGEAIAERTLKRRAGNARRQMMSAQQRKACHWTQLDPRGMTYAKFLPLHELWKQYMNSAFADELARGREPDGNRLLKADFHGAVITVVRSTIPTTIGIRGILLQETYRSFKIITEANKLVTLSKAHSIFSFAFGSVVVRLYGDQLIMRAAERTVKKFKQRNSIEL